MSGTIDLESVLSAEAEARAAESVAQRDPVSAAWGSRAPSHGTDGISPTQRTLPTLVGTWGLRLGQQEDPFFGRVRSQFLNGKVSTGPETKPDTESYFLDDCVLLRHPPAGEGQPVLAIHCALALAILSLVHTIHGYPGVACLSTAAIPAPSSTNDDARRAGAYPVMRVTVVQAL